MKAHTESSLTGSQVATHVASRAVCEDAGVAAGVEGVIVGLEREVQDAVKRRDRDALERLLAPEYRLLAGGRIGGLDRVAWIDAAVSRFVLEDDEFVETVVVAHDRTAVASSRYRQVATFEGASASSEWLLTDVWVHSGDRWRLLARHAEALAT